MTIGSYMASGAKHFMNTNFSFGEIRRHWPAYTLLFALGAAYASCGCAYPPHHEIPITDCKNNSDSPLERRITEHSFSASDSRPR